MMRPMIYFLLLSTLTSCASVLPMLSEDQDKEALLQRIQSYWQAKENDDFRIIQSFIDPDTDKNSLALNTHLNKYSNMSKISDFKIDKIEKIEKDKVKVIVTLQVTLLICKKCDNVVEQVVTDTWIKRNGYWYISLDKPSFEEILKKYQ